MAEKTIIQKQFKACFDGINTFAEALAHPEQQLPVWGLPEGIITLLEKVTDGYQTQRDFCLMSIFSAVGTLCSHTSAVFGSYVNYPTFYICLIGNSASGKTDPLSFFFEPIEQSESDAFAHYAHQMENWEATPKKERVEKPVFTHYLLCNASDESVIKELAVNQRLCWKSDELRTMFDSWGRYVSNGSGGVIVGYLLSIHSHCNITITRVSSEPVFLQKPLLNIIGGIQPKTLARTIGGKGYTEDGLFQRFLFAFPRASKIPMYSDNPVSDSLKMCWTQYLSDVYELAPEQLQETPEANFVHIQTINEWRERCNKHYRNSDAVISLMRKFEIHLCSLSIVVALLWQDGAITANNIRYCSVLCEKLIANSMRVLRLIQPSETPQEIGKKDLAKAIKELNPEATTTEIGNILQVSHQAVSKYLK